MSPGDGAGEGAVFASVDAHVAHLYDDVAPLVQRLTASTACALLHGEGALVVAVAPHAAAMAEALLERGLPVDVLRRSGRYVELDAEQLLAGAARPDGRVDLAELGAVLGRQLGLLAERCAGTVAYSELVDRLWRRGDAVSALRVEDLWNDLAHRHAFRLSCGYDSAVFERKGTAGEAVQALNAHSHVRCT